MTRGEIPRPLYWYLYNYYRALTRPAFYIYLAAEQLDPFLYAHQTQLAHFRQFTPAGGHVETHAVLPDGDPGALGKELQPYQGLGSM